MNQNKISDRTVYNMAADIHAGIHILGAIKGAPIPRDMQTDLMLKAVGPLRYIALLTDANGVLNDDINTVLAAKAPELLKTWDAVRRTLLEEEVRRREDDDTVVVKDVELAAGELSKIFNFKS